MKNNNANIDHTIVLLILDITESVIKLAIDPSSIAIAIVYEIQEGLPK
jgi:hypothetical protein